MKCAWWQKNSVDNFTEIRNLYHRFCIFFTRKGILWQSNACLIIARVCVALPEMCTKYEYDAVPLPDPSWNRFRPDTRLQIKEFKKSARAPSSVTFCTLIPKICWYYYLPLHRATTTAVQMGAPVPEIIVYFNKYQIVLWLKSGRFVKYTM
jgi:hypothetical protein